MPSAMTRMRSRGEAGFTLVELVVAMVITLVVMSALLGLFVSSLATVTQSKQRQSSAALATQTMERLRALPYDTVTVGTVTAPPAGFPYVTYSSPPRFLPGALVPGVDEELVVNDWSPRLTETVVEGVTYQVRSYVTKPVVPTGTQQYYNLTLVTSWTSNVSNGERTSVQRSKVYSPTGCLSTANRPFAAPCQAYFTAQAGPTAAGITVTNADDSTQQIPGIDGIRAELTFPVLSTNMLLEQTTTVTTTATTSEAEADVNATTSASSGGASAVAAADSDPSSAVGQSVSAATSGHSSNNQTLTGTAGSISVSPLSSDSGVSRAAVAADQAICIGADSAATALVTGAAGKLRPCASGQEHPSAGTASMTYSPPSGLGLPGAIALAEVSAWPSPTRAVAAHLTAGNTTACTVSPGPGDVGCSHSRSRRQVGSVKVGDLATVSDSLAVYDGAWTVTGLTEEALAESGPGSGTPTYTRTGMLNVWNGSGYTPLDLSTYTGSLAIPVVQETYANGSDAWLVRLESTVTVAPKGTSTSGPADCKDEPCLAQASASGGIRGETTYTITRVSDGTQLTRFSVLTDLGSLVARASYKAVP